MSPFFPSSSSSSVVLVLEFIGREAPDIRIPRHFAIAAPNGLIAFQPWKSYVRVVTAARIIEEIKQLPQTEQAQVIEYVRAMDHSRRLSGRELEKLAEKLQHTEDEAEASTLKGQITRGFYGSA